MACARCSTPSLEDAGNVIAYGFVGDSQALRDLRVGESTRNAVQQFPLALCQTGQPSARHWTDVLIGIEEVVNFSAKHCPRLFLWQQNVIFALKRHETGIRNRGCHLPTGLERNHGIAAHMKHKSGCGDLASLRPYVEGVEGVP